MHTQADKTEENKSQAVANAVFQKQGDGESTFQFVDNRPEAVAQRKLQEMANNSPRAIRLDLAEAVPSTAPGGVVQRTATPGATIYFNGDKVLYTLTGQDGVFIRAAVPPKRGFTKYKKVVATGQKAQNGRDKYELVTPAVEIDEDDRNPKEKWVDTVGGGSFGENNFMLPNDSYPHLTVSYGLNGETLTFGEAHYSRSHDDSRRLSYKRVGAGWVYQINFKGLNHDAVKATADSLIEEMTKALKG